ncbi:MAG TPA: hypothetical protein VJZ00_11220 [Thermoanaerobaculia bacterium]|nr:hypothetical protein [Thermoanaerobaculia bacterium]
MSSQDPVIDTAITAEEEYVIGRLDEMGFRAEKLARTAERKTCDLLAADDANRYLIEVKRRRSDESIARTLRKEGKTELLHHPMGFSAPTEKTMAHAVKQLDAIDATGDPFKLIWFYIDPQFNDATTLMKQVHDTAFGSANLIRMPRLGETAPVQCYFFHRSVFFKYPQLSAVVLDTGRTFTLLLNPFADRLAEFRETALFRWFDSDEGGVVDPYALESAGIAFVADCDIDRRDEHGVLTYLKKKYGLPRWGLFHLPMVHHSAFVSVPISKLKQRRSRGSAE